MSITHMFALRDAMHKHVCGCARPHLLAMRECSTTPCLLVCASPTQSNEWTGKQSFRGQNLHAVGHMPNPYEQAITIIGKTLEAFDDDKL